VTVQLKAPPSAKAKAKPAPAAPSPPAPAAAPKPDEAAAENPVYWGDALLFKLWLVSFGALVLLVAVTVLSNWVRLMWH
jgi:hypothetical protein